jgi:hypothetical protein
VRSRRAARTNFRATSRRSSKSLLTASAADTMLRCASIDSRLWW